MSLRDYIASVMDGNLTPVPVPEWNTTVYVRQLSVAEREKLFAKLDEKHTDARLTVWVCIYVLCDEHGERIFSEADYELVASKNARVIDRLGRMGGELNSMLGTAVEDAKKN